MEGVEHAFGLRLTSKKRTMKILLTDSNYGHTVAAARDLRASGNGVHVLGRRFAPASLSRAVQRAHVLNSEDSRAKQIVDVCRGNNLQGVIPVGIESVLAVDSVRAELSGSTNFVIPPHSSLQLSKDKFLLQEFARGLAIPVPSSVLVSSLDELHFQLERTSFPFVLKSVSHLCPRKPLYVKSEYDKMQLLRTNSANPYFLYGAIQIQQMVEGPGEGFFALYQHGECVRLMTHERLMEYPASGGSSWLATSTAREDIRMMGTMLLDALQWHGPAMVEFKRGSDSGTPYLMELNPKLWGSLALSISSGVRVPSDIGRMIAGERLVPDFSYTSGIVFWWPLNSSGALLGGFKALSYGPLRTNLRWLDLGPHFVEIAMLFRRCVAKLPLLREFFRWMGWVRRLGITTATQRFIGEVLGVPTRKSCEITGFIWVGAKPKRLGRLYLRLVENRVIVSLVEGSAEVPGPAERGHLHFPLPEYVEIDVSVLVRLTNTFNELEARGKKLFVHCREGVGRAPMAAISYLMYRGAPLSEALAVVQAGRGATALSELQKNSLDKLQSALAGRG